MQEKRSVVQSGGLRLAVREWPGPAGARSLLLVHGLASTSHIFDLVAPLLAPGFRVVAHDQRGHGESSKPAARYGFEHVAADAAALVRAMRLRRPVVVGHSWGASVVLELADRHPRSVGGLVLVDGGFLRMRERMDWPTAKEVLAPPHLAGMPVEEFRALIREFTADSLEVTPEVEDAILAVMRVDRSGRIRPRLSRANHFRILRAIWEQDPVELLRRVRVPTLVIGARTEHEDHGFLEAKERAAATVKAIGGNVRFAWIESIHDVPLQRPAELARLIERHVRAIGS